MRDIARKPKIASPTNNFDDSHIYRCLRCGAEYDSPTQKFYKSPWSDTFLKNDKYTSLCIKCVREKFAEYEKKYGTQTACMIMCYKLDIPYYFSLFDSICKNNNTFSMGLYLRQINGRQYQYQDFSQSLLNGECGKSESEHEKDKEIKWSKEDIANRDTCISIMGYDPFEDYQEEDRRFLFNHLIPYLEEDDISEDTYKLSQIVQIVNNNNQIRKCDKRISLLDAIKDSNDIKALNSIKKDLVFSNDKIAKENEISVKNRSNKEVGKSTLTHLQRKLRKLNIPKAEENYYDQLRSKATQWAANMSLKAIQENALFDEDEKQKIYDETLQTIAKVRVELDDEKEKNRLLQIEIDKLRINTKDGEGY